MSEVNGLFWGRQADHSGRGIVLGLEAQGKQSWRVGATSWFIE